NHGPVYQPPVFQPPAYQSPAYQAPAPQTQGVSKEDFSAYVKANDAVMRNMQTQGQNMQNQLTNLTELLTKFVNSNSASTSSSGTLPSNTIANPRSDLKKITTQSGVSYDGPQILPPPSFLPNVVGNEPKATNDTVHPTNNGSTKDVQPPVVQSESPILTSELVNYLIIEHVASPVSAPRPNQRPSISYPSRLQDQKLLLLKKLLEKLGDPGNFLFPCNFPRKAECLALADLGASINLMTLSVWNNLSLPDLTPTCMTLELADHSISHPVGVAEDVYVKVGELTLRVGKEAITFNLDQTSRYSVNYNDMTVKRIDVIDMACEEYSQEVLSFSDVITSGNPTPYYDLIVSTTSSTLTPFGNTFLNDDPSLPPSNQGNYMPDVREELKIYEAKSNKSSIDEPSKVGLKDLPRHLKYAFLEGDDKLPVIIVKDLSMEEKTALITEKTIFTCPYGTFAYRRMPFGLCNAPGMFQRCMMAILYDMIMKTMEVFMDDFLVFRNSFQICLSHLEKMLKRCEDTNLSLNWEKSHFMVKEGTVLGHKISKEWIEVDKAKVDVITKLPHPTTVKGIRSFLGHADFYRRFIKDFSKIARPMTRLLEKDTPFIFSKECVEAFQTLKRKLSEAPILIAHY
nr:reverse transcriptase domain-containing protein [Tanacetum cinerariifolium]